MHGMAGHGTCEACLSEVGDDLHRLHGCEPMRVELMWQRIAGGPPDVREHELEQKELAPLYLFGWGPIVVPWRPIETIMEEGHVGGAFAGQAFGDGAGYQQDSRELRKSTWAIVRRRSDNEDHDDGSDVDVGQWIYEARGNVGGWMPTVPRAELTALLKHLLSSRVPATYIGDCAYVINGFAEGVPRQLTSSRCADADLWKKTRWALEDHGPGQQVRKTKAHRSRSTALSDEADPIEWWEGNGRADHAARTLCRSMASADKRTKVMEETKEHHHKVLKHLAVAVEWCFRHWPATGIGSKRKLVRVAARVIADGKCGPHDMTRRLRGGWQCRHCKREAWRASGLRILCRRPCDGGADHTAHRSHKLAVLGNMLWCQSCGAHPSRMPRYVKETCVGQPRSGAYANVLRRLWRGLPPTAGSKRGAAAVGVRQSLWQHGQTPPKSGPAADPAARTTMEATTAAVEDACPTLPARRLNVKTRMPSQKEVLMRRKCAWLAEGPWSRRICADVCRGQMECQFCDNNTGTRCRSCRKPTCLACAKLARSCTEGGSPTHDGVTGGIDRAGCSLGNHASAVADVVQGEQGTDANAGAGDGGVHVKLLHEREGEDGVGVGGTGAGNVYDCRKSLLDALRSTGTRHSTAGSPRHLAPVTSPPDEGAGVCPHPVSPLPRRPSKEQVVGRNTVETFNSRADLLQRLRDERGNGIIDKPSPPRRFS